MGSANVTRRALSLGSRDSTTGWCDKDLTAETTIKGAIRPRGSTLGFGVHGFYAKYPHTFWTTVPIVADDEIIDANGSYYRVETVEEEWRLDCFEGYVSNLTLIKDHFDRPSTSGTWHVDTDSAVTDMRYRTKAWLDSGVTGIIGGNIKKDDGGSTHVIMMFAKPDYSLRRELIDNSLDAIAFISAATSKPILAYDRKPYAFNESVSITLCAINKTGITATNLIEQFEQEIRRCATQYPFGAAIPAPLGSLRQIETTDFKTEDIGGLFLYSTTITLKYKRANDDYVPTGPTFTYGLKTSPSFYTFTYEGDRLVGGSEGDWDITDHLGGSTVDIDLDSEKNLDFEVEHWVGDAFIHNKGTLGLTTAAYPRIRVRYKVVNDSGTVAGKVTTNEGNITGLTSFTSTTWTVVDVTLPGTTTNTINLYNMRLTGDGEGHVIYDFVQIYVGTYIMPNCIDVKRPFSLKDVVIGIPSMSGDITQGLGSNLYEVITVHDLDMQTTTFPWKRIGDYNNDDIFLELDQQMGIQTMWVWFNLGNPKRQFKARLVNINPSDTGDVSTIELHWREYRHGSASNESTVERFGLSL